MYLFINLLSVLLQVWAVESHQLLTTLVGHNKPVLKLAIYGKHLYSTAGRRIRVWDLDTYDCVYMAHTMPGSGALRALAVGGAWANGLQAWVSVHWGECMPVNSPCIIWYTPVLAVVSVAYQLTLHWSIQKHIVGRVSIKLFNIFCEVVLLLDCT